MAINKIGTGGINVPDILNTKDKNTNNASFSDVLEGALSSVNDKLIHADNLTKKKAIGMEVDMTENILAMQEADMSFRLMLQVRNKLMTANEEIMRMQF